ncbi:hypothetical protein P154DRAFT_539740 [Amniculicola lignicola CBS 123094]|uniref:Uncharacterized protein n=1 Tax=Amniculicola lignicola CBS 123094 TaxID=1392246 RepID=A0A6A5W527_9PLEO|nr:hypothetical protein P154DRAFT_539740 [Amniculicola lignicola CBS 123094]
MPSALRQTTHVEPPLGPWYEPWKLVMFALFEKDDARRQIRFCFDAPAAPVGSQQPGSCSTLGERRSQRTTHQKRRTVTDISRIVIWKVVVEFAMLACDKQPLFRVATRRNDSSSLVRSSHMHRLDPPRFEAAHMVNVMKLDRYPWTDGGTCCSQPAYCMHALKFDLVSPLLLAAARPTEQALVAHAVIFAIVLVHVFWRLNLQKGQSFIASCRPANSKEATS